MKNKANKEKMVINPLKIRKEVCILEKESYALDVVNLPNGGIDCSEGCNPYGFPDSVLVSASEFDIRRITEYPHSRAPYDAIIHYWAKTAELTENNILLTDGSDSGIYIVNNIFADKHAKVLGIAPQYTDYVSNAKLMGMDYQMINLLEDDDYAISVDKLIAAMTEEYSLVYIDNPNNPTGQNVLIKDIRRILEKAKALGICVIVDEAYGDFLLNEKSAMCLLSEYDNLIIEKTMSKAFGLAGLRAGYVLAGCELINCMKKVTNPYMMGEFTRELVAAALRGENKIGEHVRIFEEEKKQIKQSIGNNLTMAKTDYGVPICLLKHNDRNVDLMKLFFEHGVLTVPGAVFDGLYKNSTRVRMPVMEEFPKLLQAVREING